MAKIEIYFKICVLVKIFNSGISRFSQNLFEGFPDTSKFNF